MPGSGVMHREGAPEFIKLKAIRACAALHKTKRFALLALAAYVEFKRGFEKRLFVTRPSDITRDRILKAAERLFAERGYDHTSIRAIVAKARVNQAAINYHFDGKDGLYREVLRSAFRALTEGQITHAVYGALVGDGALFRVLRWNSGTFEIDFEGKTTLETTTLNTQGLLMEGLRLLDEAQRDEQGKGAEEEEDDVLLDS